MNALTVIIGYAVMMAVTSALLDVVFKTYFDKSNRNYLVEDRGINKGFAVAFWPITIFVLLSRGIKMAIEAWLKANEPAPLEDTTCHERRGGTEGQNHN